MEPRLRVTGVVEHNGKYLLIEENIMTEDNQLFWLFPGGGVEDGETLEEAILREIKEETGLVVEIVKPLYFYERIIPEKEFHTLNFYFLLKKISGELKAEAKAKDIAWLTKEEAQKKNLLELNRKIVGEYL